MVLSESMGNTDEREYRATHPQSVEIEYGLLEKKSWVVLNSRRGIEKRLLFGYQNTDTGNLFPLVHGEAGKVEELVTTTGAKKKF